MADPEIGDRFGQWFWSMIESLGLMDMDDRHFRSFEVERLLEQFLNKEYAPDGRGGLFTVSGYRGDIRDLDIWYQMCAYLEKFS